MMSQVQDNTDVSIQFTLTLEDGTPVTSNVRGDRFHYTPGQDEIMPALEEALKGATKGEKKRFVLSPSHDPDLKLDVTRLAHLLGYPGRTLVLEVEIL